jgi:hypothetical protein
MLAGGSDSQRPAIEFANERFEALNTRGDLTNVAADKHFSDAASPQW